MKSINNRIFMYLCVAFLSAFSAAEGTSESAHLHLAIKQGKQTDWNGIILEGGDIHAKDSEGNTPLHLAALHQNQDCVKALLEHGARVNVKNSAGATPLLYGITHLEIVRMLLDYKADPNMVSKSGMTPLLAAVSRGQSYAIAKLLVDAGADVQVMREGPWDGGALYRAIQSGDPRTIELMFEKGAPMEPVGKSFSPLHVAAMVGDLKSVKRLVVAGVDLNYSDNGWGDAPGHALNWAMWSEKHEVAAYLIDQGIDLNFAPSIGNQTPPMVWAGFGQEGDPTIAKKLVARGLDVNTENATGETALSYALKTGENTELVQFLKQHGVKSPRNKKNNKAIPSRNIPPHGPNRKKIIRDRAQRALEVMQSSSEKFLRRPDSCASCHHQFLPALAYGMAQERGLNLDLFALGHQLKTQVGDRNETTGDNGIVELAYGGFSGGSGLIALNALGYRPDANIYNHVRYIRETQSYDGTWSTFGRPPLDEPSPFQMTAWSIKAMTLFPRAGEDAITSRSIERAMDWMRENEPDNLNQRNMQLLGLKWGGESYPELQKYAQAIMDLQRPDGGWAQLETLESDAWATGQTLYALHEVGELSPEHPAHQQGVEFLLRTQYEDGSWWVKSRAWPFQPHFDSGFPHGKDQWISIAATAWATMALLTAIEPVNSTKDFPTGQELIALWEAKQNEKQKVKETVVLAAKQQTADFQTDIRPILERSCLSCHSGERAKGDFRVNSRGAILKGGQSATAAIHIGDSAKSPLVNYVMDQIEDLEMPPLARRNKYPALTSEEINKLTMWINEGAYWPEGVVLE
jgi:ankyrin repeat protein